jgi:hypothetical protein
MSTADADRPEGQTGSGIGFYFNADDTWHSDAEAPRRVWDPAWIAPQAADAPAEPPVHRRRSGLAVAVGLVLVAGAAVALAWSLTPGRRPAPQLRQTEPPSVVLTPPLPVKPPASTAAPVAQLAPAPVPARTAAPAPHAAAVRPMPHHRQYLRTTHRRHWAPAHSRARPHATTLKRPAAHRSKSAPASVRRSWRQSYPAAHSPRHGHPPVRIRRASKAAT